MKYILAIVCIVLIGVLFLNGLQKEEVVQCNKWQREATEYPGYYLKQWQKDQCEHHDILIDAPVR